MNRFYKLLLLLLFFRNTFTKAQQINRTSTLYKSPDNGNTTFYSIGVILPDAANLTDPRNIPVVNTIITNELAIIMAAKEIDNKNILEGVGLNITRYYSSIDSSGYTAWETYRMVDDEVHAVIGDVTSVSTKASASMTSVWTIPQCSAASGSFSLSDKTIYPYFFRTIGTSISHMGAIANWIKQMGWEKFTFVYSNDAMGQEVYDIMETEASTHNLSIISHLAVYPDVNEAIANVFKELNITGSRVVVLALSRVREQIRILKQAKENGFFNKGWVWVLSEDVSMMEYYGNANITSLDGLIFIRDSYDLKGLPQYDEMFKKWQTQQIPANYSNPAEWNTSSLYYNAAQAYSCVDLLALGMNKALNQYPGGRSEGLAALSSKTFNSTNMKPTFFNLNYTGPAGKMDFSASGDLKDGYFQMLFLKNGQPVPFANIKLGSFENINGVDIIYPGDTKTKPKDIAEKNYLNPKFNKGTGIIITVICVLGISFCLLMMVLIFIYRDLKPIMISSPVFCYLQLVGITMMYATPLLYFDKPTVPQCISRQLVMSTGLVLVVGSIIAKNYRIYKIYQNVFTIRTSRLKSSYLLRIVAIFELIAILPHIIWNAIYKVEVETFHVTDRVYCWYCQYPQAISESWGRFDLAIGLEMIWLLLLIIFSAVIAFKTRSVNRKWSESTQITYVSYNLAISAIVMIPSLLMSAEQYTIALWLFIGSILFGTTFTLLTLFIPKLMCICKYIFQSNHLHNLYSTDSDDHDQISIHSSNSMDQNIQLKLVAKNMYDFTAVSYEGILPVKKLAKIDLLSIWTLKRITLVPYKKYFILSSKTSKHADVYKYTLCETISTGNQDHHTFRVRTDKGGWFLFQVCDHSSLNRWVNWFNEDPYRNNNEQEDIDERTRFSTLALKPKRVNELATFGAPFSESNDNRNTLTDTANQTPFSETNSYSMLNSHLQTNDFKSYYQSETSRISDDIWMDRSGANQQNSFGVINDSRQRYP
ncbi:periplasmic binding protein-like I [Sporodiniella umbellata]|nr:periplasmic binding protein-like I [Sporodiniella umbellata]